MIQLTKTNHQMRINMPNSVLCVMLLCSRSFVESFVLQLPFECRHTACRAHSIAVSTDADFDVGEVAHMEDQPFALDEEEDLERLTVGEVKSRLIELVPRMMGSAGEFKLVESYVNVLEDRFEQIQTLDFLNLAMSGEWQLLFSTNFSGGPKPHFRLREQYQRVETNSLKGLVSNTVVWDLAEDGHSFQASGSFTVKCPYQINQGARMVMELEENVLKLAKGSDVPKDVEGLVGLLHRMMPKELFDPSDHAMDTTYLDADIRIVRMTGPRFEGVRDIFMRRGTMEVDPRSVG
jgi:hypothetical protein